ncbi:MAG: hypothetical protein JTT11_10065 [Candidatus Brockarchaeota archaeon]|nr:hypothetical protein [Candidatus Brockarchaeota archaeon]
MSEKVSVSELLKGAKIDPFKYPNVVGFSEELRPKIVKGAETKTLAIRIYVKEKKAKEELKPDEIFPAFIGSYETDVVEVGEIKALSVTDRKARFGIIPGSVSVAEEHVTAGTHTMALRDKTDGKTVTSSNWHVFGFGEVDVPGSRIVQPGPYDGGNPGTDTYARLKRWVPIKSGQEGWPWWRQLVCSLFGGFLGGYCRAWENKVDFAVGDLTGDRPVDAGLLRDDGSVFKPTSKGRAAIGDRVWKVGRTTGETEGLVVDDSATISVNYGFATFVLREQILTNKMLDPGDSGSPLLKKGTNDLVGLGLAGSSTTSVFSHWANVEAYGQVELI